MGPTKPTPINHDICVVFGLPTEHSVSVFNVVSCMNGNAARSAEHSSNATTLP